MTRAPFISLEGGEGAGKSTVLEALRGTLADAGFRVVSTREPGGTPEGEAVRALLLDTGATLVPEAELLLMFASRAQLVRQVIAPALARGDAVLTDRFTDASFAYQGGGRGLDPARIAELERWAAGLRPDLTILLDVDVAEGLARARSRGGSPDRIESERAEFFERVRRTYRARAAADPRRFRVVDAGQPLEQVIGSACAAVAEWLSTR